MGWIFTLACVLMWSGSSDTTLLVAAGLFAIAGAISNKSIK